MSIMDRYDRAGNRIVSDEEFYRLITDLSYKIVAKSAVGEVDVSTVWLGMNHAFDDDATPVIFETMVFGGKLDQECERYCTEAEARTGHQHMVELVMLEEGKSAVDVTLERIAEYQKAQGR